MTEPQDRILVKFKRLHSLASIPKRATSGSAGFDLSLPGTAFIRDVPERIPLGFAMELPEGWEAQIRPRSSTTQRYGLYIPFGTIDSDYRGEVALIVSVLSTFGASGSTVVVPGGISIAQMLFARVPRVEWLETDQLEQTDRGTGGFGSTGWSLVDGEEPT